MMRVEEIVEIDRPLEEVFPYVTNPENLPEWSSLVLEVRKESEGDLREGYRFTTAAKFLGRRFETPFEVSDHEPDRRHSDTSRGGPFEQEYTYTLEETGGGGTRLTWVAEAEPGGFFRLVGPLLERAGRRQFRADLQNLKDLLETEADT
jgi:carbon monoxide dehydrogenase subunit G